MTRPLEVKFRIKENNVYVHFDKSMVNDNSTI